MRFLQWMLYICLSLMFAIIMTGYLFSPKKVKMTQEIVISQSPSFTYNRIIDFTEWYQWSPWYLDSNTIRSYADQSMISEGMSIHWGDTLEERGYFTVISLKEDSEIKAELTMSNPIYSKTDMSWSFESVPQGTRLTVTNEGARFQGPLERFFGGFLSQKRLEKEFSNSLQNFKLYCES